MRLLLLLALVTAAPALAENDCKLSIGKDDIFARGKRVEVPAGKKVEDVLAVDGDVVVKAGASVGDVIAVGGTVTLEAGATVRGSVIVAGGKLTAHPSSKIEGSQIHFGDHGGLSVKGEDGDRIEIQANVDGKDLGNEIARKIVEALRQCRVDAGT